MNEVAKTRPRRRMEELYEEQIRRARHRAEDLEFDIDQIRQVAERTMPVDAYEGDNGDVNLIINALFSARSSAAAWKMKAEEAVRVSKVNETFADSCIDRLSAVVRYATANFQPLDKHRADLVDICNAKQPEGGHSD